MNPFETVSLPRRGRSKFNLSFSRLLAGDMGQLIPIAAEEMVPGDFWQIANEMVIRFMPMVAPVVHAIYATIHWFAVPYRLLWSGWEDFITGGVTGGDVQVLPRWTPDGGNVTNDDGATVADNGVGSLWDFMGFPVNIIPTGAIPMDFPKRAYNLVVNEYYLDETHDTPLNIDTSEIVMNRRWRKDYFTSALPWQQRGTAPALPISGTAANVFHTADIANDAYTWALGVKSGVPNKPAAGAGNQASVAEALSQGIVDLSSATTFDINDLRTVVAVQRWLELNARGGVRYTEWLQSHYGVSPRDERVQRPEYIGGFRAPVIVSEVLQTSKTEVGAPQGNLAGHGITADRQFCGTYRCEEFAVLLGLLSVTPETVYDKRVDRQWLRTSRYDFYDPLFANLSEQAIQVAELWASAVQADNEEIFGYQGRWDEMRIKHSQAVGKMQGTFDYWHIARQFSGKPGLNSTFLKCIPRKDFLAAPTEITFVANVGNNLLATRMMPAQAEPGMVE